MRSRLRKRGVADGFIFKKMISELVLAALAKVVQMSRESGENPTSVIEQRLAELRKAFGSENPLSQYPQNCPILLSRPIYFPKNSCVKNNHICLSVSSNPFLIL